MPKILIVYASFGQGHKKAAQALGRLPQSSLSDLLDFAHPLVRKIYSLSYLAVSQYFPWLWKGLFFCSRKNLFSSLVNKLNCLLFSPFLKYLKNLRPEIIIVTHFFPSSLMTAVKKDLGFKLVSVITDLRVHSLWVAGCIDHYFTALKITKSDLINLGVSQEKVTCGFVPVRAGFLRRDSRESLAKKFKLDSRPSIIFVSFPRGRFPYLRKSIQVLEDSFNIFIIYGSNRGLKRRLEKLGSARIRFFPFYDEIWELFRLSSVIISKPGGMTVFEGLCMKKSFVFTHYIPGQEAANMELLVKGGVARFARIGKELVDAVNYYNEKADSRKDNYPFEVNDVIEPLSALIERWSNG